tara:strand:- start:369 stop:710 length:342 start_codon:yes stop_codon:yes gene_type:complete
MKTDIRCNLCKFTFIADERNLETGVCVACGSENIDRWYPLPSDNVSSPSHYTSGNIEVIDAIEDWQLDKDHYLACAVKYIARAGKKNPDTLIEDLRKARWYLDRRIGDSNDNS